MIAEKYWLKKGEKRTIEVARKGGATTSPARALSSSINTLRQHPLYKNLPRWNLEIIRMWKDGKIDEVIKELIAVSLKDTNNPVRRDKVLEQIMKLLPEKKMVLNVNADANQMENSLTMFIRQAQKETPVENDV